MKPTDVCMEYQALISAEVDGEIDERELVELRRHLAQCGDCRKWQAAASRLSERVGAMLDAEIAEPITKLQLNGHPRKEFMPNPTSLAAPAKNASRSPLWFLAVSAILFISAGISLAIFVNGKPSASTVSVQPLVDLHAVNVQSEHDQQAMLNTVELDLRAMKLQLRGMDLDAADRKLLENRIDTLLAKTRRLDASTPTSYQGE